MKKKSLILLLVLFILIIKACIPKNDNNIKGDTKDKLLTNKIENDKIIIVREANYKDIKKATQQFCNLYNKENYTAIIKLTKFSENISILTFPYDIDFKHFCFLVNYLYYPHDIFYRAEIKAWATTKKNDEFIQKDAILKKVMLFIPPEDKEYDNVYMTTEDNKGYILGFAIDGVEVLNSPREIFINNEYKINDIENKSSEEIK